MISLDHAAGHGVVLVQRALGGQRLHRGQPPPAGDHRVAPGAIRAGFHGTGNQVLKQPVGCDRGLELGEGRSIGRRLAHVAGREFELGQRDVADFAFGVVHVGLRDCVNAEPGRGHPLRHPDLIDLGLKLSLLVGYWNRMGRSGWSVQGQLNLSSLFMPMAGALAKSSVAWASAGSVRYPPRTIRQPMP